MMIKQGMIQIARRLRHLNLWSDRYFWGNKAIGAMEHMKNGNNQKVKSYLNETRPKFDTVGQKCRTAFFVGLMIGVFLTVYLYGMGMVFE